MKIEKATRLFAGVLFLALFAIYGCGGGGGGGSSGSTTSTTSGTTISGASQAGSAGGASTQGASVGANTGSTLSNVASTVGAPKYRSPLFGKDTRYNKIHAAEERAMKTPAKHFASVVKKAKALPSGSRRVPTMGNTELCIDGGTVAFSGSYTTTSISMTMTYNNCREYGEQVNGIVTVTDGTFSGTGFTFTMRVGGGNAVGAIDAADFKTESFNSTYTNLYARVMIDMAMTGSMGATAESFTFTANGKEEYTDFTETYTMTFTNVIFSSSLIYNSNTNTISASDTLNGTFTESWTSASGAESVSITFGDADTSAEATTDTNPDFTVVWTETPTYYDFTVDGRIVIDYATSDTDCLDGTFLIDTTTAVRESLSTGKTTQGRIVVNSNTVIVFNADGTVTVTTDNTSTSYTSIEALEAVCSFEDFEDDSASETSFNNTGTTSTTTSGTTLLVTLTWTGTGCPINTTTTTTDDCTSDMDLHLAHFATAPTLVSDTTDWEIYYANDDPSTVLPNDDPNTSIIYNTTGDVVGGYEGNLDYDDTEGYGPEHITVESLPTGYYVLYVDPFSLDSDTTATVTVTLNIGGTIYTFPTHTFSSTAAASYRVVDISVDSTGTVTLLPPDTTNFPALLYPAPGARPAKARR